MGLSGLGRVRLREISPSLLAGYTENVAAED
jgi:hypothetical protein